MSNSTSANCKCKYCKKDLIRSFSIECAECQNFILCSDCFAAGVELHPHKNNHKYKVSDCLEFPIFVKDWTVSEELALLEGIERHGMGNWKTISEYINTNKTTKAVEEHYWELYMGTHGYCLPTQFMWKDQLQDTASFCAQPTSKADSLSSTSSSSGGNSNGVSETEGGDLHLSALTAGYTRGEAVRRDEGFSGLGHSSKSTNKDKQELRDKLAQLPGSDLPGFFPLRGDFDFEYENDADKMLADMEFSLDEHPSERELKLQVIRIYNHKLQERNRRKDFVIERGLIDFKLQQQQDKRRTKEERDLVGRLRVFARFQSKEEHEALVEGLLRAGKLRQQIELYRTYRQMGVRTLDQAKQYEANKRLREKDAKARKHRDSAPHLFQSGQGSSSQQTDFPEESGKLTGKRRGRDSSSSSLQEDGRKSFRGGSSAGDSETSDASPRGGGAGHSSSGGFYNSPSGRGSGEAASSRSGQQEDPAVLARAPGGDLLSDLELHLCAQVPMMPLHYLAAKDALVREAYRNGSLTQEGVKRLLKFDADGVEKVYDFFVKEMLINEPPKREPMRI